MSIDQERAANDKLAERYFHIWDTYPIQRFTHELESAWLREEIQPGSRILLAGSGGGREIEALYPLANKIIAVDISPEMLRVGAERFGRSKISWRIGNIERLDSSIADVDVVVALGGVLIYVREIEKALSSLYGILRPSGKLFLSVMNRMHPTERHASTDKAARYRHPFEVAEIEQLLVQAGFEKIIIKGYRFLIDLLPPDWNADPTPSTSVQKIMSTLLEVEREYLSLGKAEDAKMLWVSASKPGK